MPNPVVYYQKGRGKVNGYQQIAAMHAIAHEGLSSAISNSHNNDQFHEAISHLK